MARADARSRALGVAARGIERENFDIPGDVTMAKLPEVEALAKGGSARVQR